jgi:hypothetical protein
MSVGREESTLVPGAIFFSCETWNTGCTADEEGSWSLKATGPILAITSYDPKNLKANFWLERGAREDWTYG